MPRIRIVCISDTYIRPPRQIDRAGLGRADSCRRFHDVRRHSARDCRFQSVAGYASVPAISQLKMMESTKEETSSSGLLDCARSSSTILAAFGPPSLSYCHSWDNTRAAGLASQSSSMDIAGNRCGRDVNTSGSAINDFGLLLLSVVFERGFML
jgi:hypothetical protein